MNALYFLLCGMSTTLAVIAWLTGVWNGDPDWSGVGLLLLAAAAFGALGEWTS